MANNIAENQKFLINDNGDVERDLSAFITEVRGLPGTRETRDNTVLGDTGRGRHPGLQDGRFTISGLFDNTATTGPDAVLGPLRTSATARTFKFGPAGSGAGAVRYTGTCFVESYVAEGAVGGMEAFTCELVVDGAITRDTF